MAKTVFVKRRGSNSKLDTDISEAIGHADGNETGLGRPFWLFADTPLPLRSAGGDGAQVIPIMRKPFHEAGPAGYGVCGEAHAG